MIIYYKPFWYFSDTSDVVESLNQITSPYKNEALEIVLKNGLIYVYSPKESVIMISRAMIKNEHLESSKGL